MFLKIKFEKPRAKYKAEHEAELIQFYAARRKLTGEFPDDKVDMKKLSDEYDELEQAHNTTYGAVSYTHQMCIRDRPTGLRVFSKNDISHLHFYTLGIGQREGRLQHNAFPHRPAVLP